MKNILKKKEEERKGKKMPLLKEKKLLYSV